MTQMNESASSLPKIVLTPLRQGVPAQGGTMEVLVRVQAPAQPAQSAGNRRPQLRLSLVVDRSGSMDGEPLAEAMRCVQHIVGRLQPADQVAVVLYDDNVQVPVPLQPAVHKTKIQAALAGVESGGSTALFDGWEAGARQLEAGSANAMSRVILLSDGQANQGLVDPADIQRHCAEWLAKGVSTTTVGLGRGFNEELMIGMARAGGGQQYYGQKAEDLYDSFDEELALLESLYLRRLRVRLVAAAGVIAQPLGLVQPAGQEWFGLSDLAWGAESWLLVRLHVAAGHEATAGALRSLLAVDMEAQARDGDWIAVTSPVLALPSLDAPVFDALPQDDVVAKRLLEIQFGESAARARTLIEEGKSDEAQAWLARLAPKVAGHPWLAEKLRSLQALAAQDATMAAKEIHYNQRRMSTRLAAVQEMLYSGDETNAQNIPAFLRRKGSEGTGRRK
jgi:Ca-activated chloride channel family protein